MAVKLYKRRMLGVKTDTTQSLASSAATPPAFASSDYLPAYDFTISPIIEQLDSTVVSPNLGSPANVPGLKNYDVDLKFWLRGANSAGAMNGPIDALFSAAGLVFDGNGKYVASSSNITNFLGPAKSVTINGNYDGTAMQCQGTVGNMKLVFEQGKKVDMNFTGKGLYTSSAFDEARLPSGSYGATIEPNVQSIGFQIGGTLFTADKVEVDFGNAITAISDVNSPNGIGGYIITDRKPVGTLMALAVNVAQYDFFGRFDSGSVASGSLTVGTQTGNKFVFEFNSIQYSDVKWANQNGLINVEATLKFNEDDTNPWLQVTAL